MMVSIIRRTCIVAAIACLPVVAAAGTGGSTGDESDQVVAAGRATASAQDPGGSLAGSPFAAAVTPPDTPGPPAPRAETGNQIGRRDSLWNGVLIGAGVGALIGALGGDSLIECSECAGFNVPLTFGVVGAGVGAAVGAGIDALRHTRSPTPGAPGRVVVAPVFGRAQRAVRLSVRF